MGVGLVAILQRDQQAGFLVMLRVFAFLAVSLLTADVQQAIVFVFDLFESNIVDIVCD